MRETPVVTNEIRNGLIARVSPQGIAFVRDESTPVVFVFPLDLLPEDVRYSLQIGQLVRYTLDASREAVLAVTIEE